MKAKKNIIIWIYSSQTLIAEALKVLLKSENRLFKIYCYPPNKIGFKHLSKTPVPDIILFDTFDSNSFSWQYIGEIRESNKFVKIIMLADTNASEIMTIAIQNGASGFLLKSSTKENLLSTIDKVMDNLISYDSNSNPKYKIGILDKIKEKYNLSSREIEIITLIKDGFSSKEIAIKLGISFHTIEAHRKNIYNKLNINKVTELLKIFADFGE